MPTIAPPALVVGAPRIPLPFGLFSVFSPRENSADRWLAGGVTWEQITSEMLEGIGQTQIDTDDIQGIPKVLDKLGVPLGEATDFAVYGHYRCSPIGNSFQHAYDQAVEQLNIRAEAQVEQALWTGDLGNVPNFAGANGYLAPTDLGTVTLEDSLIAVAQLEQHIATEYGSQGVIHMSRFHASILTKNGELRQQGGRLLTGLNTPVVAGTGYGDEKIVVSPALFGYRSDIFPGQTPNTDGSYLNRANNDLTAIAEQSYLIGFDTVGLASVDITLPV